MLVLIMLLVFIILIITMIFKVKNTLKKLDNNELDSKSVAKMNELNQKLLDEANKRKF